MQCPSALTQIKRHSFLGSRVVRTARYRIFYQQCGRSNESLDRNEHVIDRSSVCLPCLRLRMWYFTGEEREESSKSSTNTSTTSETTFVSVAVRYGALQKITSSFFVQRSRADTLFCASGLAFFCDTKSIYKRISMIDVLYIIICKVDEESSW